MPKYLPLLMALFAPLASAASCPGGQPLASIDFDRNSSYFNQSAMAHLQQLQQLTIGAPGDYLLLEFSLAKSATEKDREYNRWLGMRRIDRIKAHLAATATTPPLISRINTAANGSRTVYISLCPGQMNANQPRWAE
ncbi:hypothetical protein NFHSH190041_07710 [Shewanella sp. NFH-SH190041]|uniref:hypothetical protein n=1 Tax=Shewanella sp. NFH-SH190041 TaxID=2950245 RepID=UPI0021C351F7|nr:hypothetical protein [Shewanella sp. NFH-SH190041]BDM63319.1 hypothetical protein NFHSH190041_07710 [Shewanella sp. NFH-SH190041]